MSDFFVNFREPLRARAAFRVHDLAAAIWDRARLGHVRYMTATDLVLIQVVGRLDALANRLDPPW